MNNDFYALARDKDRGRRKPGRLRSCAGLETGFICKHCGGYVSTDYAASGVRNRNHCPYCLWSRHVDLYAAGDRLAACKAPMRPLGLSLKATRNRYVPDSGELMLIHLCADCGSLSLNRIAADDVPEALFAVFAASLSLDAAVRDHLKGEGIRLLLAADERLVRLRLYGCEASLALAA
jgi:hypothetical protein